MNVNQVAEAILRVSESSGSISKMSLLKTYGYTDGFKDVLHFIYNPYLKSGISRSKLEKARAMRPGSDTPILHGHTISFKQAIEHFSAHCTGSDADVWFAARFINAQPASTRWLAEALVTQDLKIGVTATTLNKVYGNDFIPKIGCMLGKQLSVVGGDIKWPCIVTEKLDGARRLLIKENDKIRMFTRSGHEDFGLVDIVHNAELLPDNMVYDGELLAIGKFKDSIALRQATNSIANSKGDRAGLMFWVFDMIPLDEFYSGLSKHNAMSRKLRLGATFADETISALLAVSERRSVQDYIRAFKMDLLPAYIRPVPILGVVSHLSQVDDIVQPILASGGEGVMLNTATGLYELKRSKQLIKVKKIEEIILPIVSFMEGNGKYQGMLGSVVVEYKGNLVGVGSGFTDAQRRDIWRNQDLYKGYRVEIDTFGESTNAVGQRSLNCPIFKRFC